MTLRESKGNMYPWVTHTWGPVAGRCSHRCAYCYMRQFKLRPIRLVNSAFKDDLGNGHVIFVCSGTDLFAADVPAEWIRRVLGRCWANINNAYLFQSKNPARFREFERLFPQRTICGTTLESDVHRPELSGAPSPEERAEVMTALKDSCRTRAWRRMVSIEPVMRFNLGRLAAWLRRIEPDFVSIGADSKRHGLPEPPAGELRELISALEEFTQVKLKANLARLLGREIKDRRAT